ncbi:MAG: serine/threonine-protein phosphatase [Phycisphaerales bacterium]|nr:serine/threonine-protein phosphatase [Phycisphaerales bacterium]
MMISPGHEEPDQAELNPDVLLPEIRQGFVHWMMAAGVLALAVTAWQLLEIQEEATSSWVKPVVIALLAFSPVGLAVYLGLVKKRLVSTAAVYSAVTVAMLIAGGLVLAAAVVSMQNITPDPTVSITIPVNGLTLWMPYLLVLYALASVMIPMPPPLSFRGPLVLTIVWAIAVASTTSMGWDSLGRVAAVIVGVLFLVPGLVLSTWRWGRFQERLHHGQLQGHVERLGGELVRAREVHEGLFPEPMTGPVSFEYVYVPNEQIGGDFLHAWRCPKTGRTTIVLLDVVGHGLTAALTVNRLSGELDRLRAEFPDIGPGDLMSRLNRYIYLTMAQYSIYTTAGCFEIDPVDGVLRWVLAGHPPAMLRRENGSVEELECTAVLLGAVPDAQFDPDEQRTTVAPGDVIFGYTDGTIESRNPAGEEFTIDRMRDCVGFDTPPRDWPRFILNAVERHHAGNQTDDILVVCITYDHPHIPLDQDSFDPLDSTSLYIGTRGR